ncbi:MAG: DUF2298 domain-containing protein [bacterium]
MKTIPGSVIDMQGIEPSWGAGTILVGRFVTALCGSLTILLLYLIGRDAYGRGTGLLAAAFLAVAVLPVQLSHFCTVDIVLAFWIAVAIFSFHRIALQPRLAYYLLGAVATGFAVGTKWSAITLPGMLLLAHAIGTWGREEHGQTGRWINTIWLLLFGAILAHFFRAASYIGDTFYRTGALQETFYRTLGEFRDFYATHWLYLALFAILFFLISIVLLYYQSWWRGDGRWGQSLLKLYLPWLFLVVSIPIAVGALFVAEPLAFLDSASFARDVCEQHGLIVTGDRTAVYTQQYVGTMPIFYSLDNLFYPSLDWVTAFSAIAGVLFSVYMAVKYRHRSDILLLAWLLPNFLLYSTFLCKFPRYLITIIPFFLLFGARFLISTASIRPAMYSAALANWPMWAIRGAKRVGIAGILLSLVCGAIYGFAYIGIYQRPHTYYQAADWLKAHDAQNKRILGQLWDEWLPGVSSQAQLGLHLGDSETNLDSTLSLLSKADYLVLPSKRAYGTTFRLPKRFPQINRFFQLLFSEQLGYELAATVTSEPRIGFGSSSYTERVFSGGEWPRVSLYNLSCELSSDVEDESFRVYDHPKVVIFRNVKRLTASQMRAAITNPPDWLEKVSWERILRARAGHSIFEPEVKFPGLTWYIGLQILSLCAFVFLFGACSSLTDRGYGLAKIVGLILFAWISWFLASTGLFPFSQGQLIVVFLVLLIGASFLAHRRRAELRAFWNERWGLIVGMEVLFLTFWWILLCIRAHHPDVFWGEKPMEFSFLNAVYRTSVFPPIDPWISGRPINYYYYGYVVFGCLGRLLAIPPAYVFNLGIATAPALLAIGSFALIYNLCRSWKAGLLGSYLIVFSGHLISYGRFIESYRQHILGDQSAGGFLPSLLHWFTYFPLALKVTANVFLSALGLVKRLPEETLRFLHMHGNTYFWASGHDVVRGTAANEFPVWSFFFADFHPHMIVMPMTVAALGLALAFFLRKSDSRGDHITTVSDYGTLGWFALVLGTIVCTNTWDLPGLGIVLGLVILLRFLSSSPFVSRRIERGSWISPRGFSVLAADLVLPLTATLLAAWVLFAPFHHNFIPRVSEIRWMTEGNTPLSTMMTFFGILLWPCVTLLVWRWAFPSGLDDFRLKRTAALLCLFAATFAVAAYVNTENPLNYPPPHTDHVGLGTPSDYSSAALLFPFLCLATLFAVRRRYPLEERFAWIIGILGLGILFGCEFVYLKETWSEPAHRWNTVFKFYLQAWIYLGLAAAVGACLFWRDLRRRGTAFRHWRLRRFARVGWALVTIVLLFASLVFPIAGGFSITLTDTNDNKGLIPSLDGMSYLMRTRPDEGKAFQFINQVFEGGPVVLEAHAVAREYLGDYGWVSWNTGCPTILGWGNHVHERLHDDEISARRQAVDRIFATQQPDEFLRLLGTYDVDYIYYGASERKASPGCERRWSGWGHILDVVACFDLGEQSQRATIYAVRKNLNELKGVTTSESPAAAPLMEKETGLSMFVGGAGFGNGQFQEPRGICVDSKNRVYVTDTRNYRLQVFDKNGAYFGQIGERGTDAAQFEEPMDVAVDRTDRVYVLDTWNHRVQVFDANGAMRNIITGDFYGPRGIAIDLKTGVIFVTDTGHHQVKIFSANGEMLARIGRPDGRAGSGEGEFQDPVGIDITADGKVLVADTGNDRIQILDLQGRYLGAWPVGFTKEPNRGVEAHLIAAPDGSVFVTDPIGSRILAFDSQGNLAKIFQKDQTGERFRMPNGIALTAEGALLVTDLGWHKVFGIPLGTQR